MTLRTPADPERIAIEILLANTDVTTIFGNRIGTELNLTDPAQLPALRVTTVSTRPIVKRHLDGGNVQVESWATSRTAAKDNLKVARAALLADGLEGIYTGGVLTGIEEGTGPVPRPDPRTERPRWLTTFIVYAHPPVGVP